MVTLHSRRSPRAALALTVLVALMGASAPLRAQQNDSTEIVNAAATLLRAISTKDTALARTVLLPGMQFAAVASPASPTTRARWQADTTFYRSLPSGTETLLERMWNATVVMHGSVATLAAPYDFHIDGKFSHCGTDVFILVRHQNVWRISAVQYTVQRQNCAPSPLGPPR